MLNQSKKTAEDRRRPQKHAEHRRIQKSSQKMAEETSIDRETQKIAKYCENIAEIPRRIAEDSKRPQKNERKTNKQQIDQIN